MATGAKGMAESSAARSGSRPARSLAAAWAGQLSAAGIPLPEVNRWIVPFIEMGVGAALLVGFYTRLATLLVLNIMVVATYVHLVVHDPALFPLQPVEPIGPLVLLAMLLYVIWKGAGRWSVDLSESQ